jgi:hypothetical protein
LPKTSIGDFCQKVKSPHPQSPSPESSRLDCYLHRVGARTESVRRLAQVALAVAGPGAEITERQLQELAGYALSTVRLACKRLVGLKVLSPIPKPLGRGYLKAYRVVWGQKHRDPHQASDLSKSRRTKTKVFKDLKNTTKDVQSQGGLKPQLLRRKTPLRGSERYQGAEAKSVILVLGARFYRQAMRETRLGLEAWELPERIRHALEGFIGDRFDGMTLADARGLVAKIWAMRAEIEALARSGASPRRVCAFVAGRLAGKPDRAKREVLRRTAELIRESLDLELIERRITGLRRFAAEREAEYQAGQICRRCGYRHSRIEYESGYRDDGTGTLSCFGWARIKLEELHEQAKLSERRQRELHCRHCGGSLREGQVEGYCWSCWGSPPIGKILSQNPTV